ncbi:hypothetical protein [Dysgonomonas sp. 511]|uniref:hypothetical protein n=1 Tax=Dysgonomonas sp. 511 TaxID=2302930 RepID=UPI0013D7A086|nr:hypothetical protein [Dysgonomonas sp. 511]NDV79815.1 hypothetical protein [Dysgonomonas sp. 511]
MDYHSYYIVLIIIWGLAVLFCTREVRLADQLSSQNSKYLLWTQIVLFVGILIRTIHLDVPLGTFVDETISAYDSWCLANYGVDQHLASYPVYLKSWGTGQSAVYAYLGIPFIKLFGFSIPVYRLPMAIVSCASLVIFYYTLRKSKIDHLLLFVIILFLVANPWHLMKSRWALDCNLAPDFLLICISLFILGYKHTSHRLRSVLYLSACIFLALAAYSYAVSWFMMPFFCIFLYIFLYRNGKIDLRQSLYCIALLIVLLLPLVLFAYSTVSEGEQYQLGPITITALDRSRHEETTIIGLPGAIYLFIKNMRWAFDILTTGFDAARWNSFPFFGQFYNVIFMPFILWAIFCLRKKNARNLFDNIFFIWLFSTLPILLLVTPNVNHWNMVWLPVIYFAARGIYFVIQQISWSKYPVIIGILVLFGAFAKEYIAYNTRSNPTPYPWGFVTGYEELLDFAKTKQLDSIIFDTHYPRILFHEPIDPYFYNSVKIEADKNGYKENRGYLNYRVYKPDSIVPLAKTGYIISKWELEKYEIDTTLFQKKQGDGFTLYWND